MPKFLITLPLMSADRVKSAWTAVIKASVGSELHMNNAYIDHAANQAICCWDAPDRRSVEELFSRASVSPETIREVVEYAS